ncbi:MAG: hypothetical protein VYC25_10490, partial [Actinomycetota bacterium]|nr:hypothetical protein [Actinomycetota bacterium]
MPIVPEGLFESLDRRRQRDQTSAMEHEHAAELSSVATQLADLVRRVEDLAGEETADRTTDRSALLEVERHLRGALREMERFRRTTKGR